MPSIVPVIESTGVPARLRYYELPTELVGLPLTYRGYVTGRCRDHATRTLQRARGLVGAIGRGARLVVVVGRDYFFVVQAIAREPHQLPRGVKVGRAYRLGRLLDDLITAAAPNIGPALACHSFSNLTVIRDPGTHLTTAVAVECTERRCTRCVSDQATVAIARALGALIVMERPVV